MKAALETTNTSVPLPMPIRVNKKWQRAALIGVPLVLTAVCLGLRMSDFGPDRVVVPAGYSNTVFLGSVHSNNTVFGKATMNGKYPVKEGYLMLLSPGVDKPVTFGAVHSDGSYKIYDAPEGEVRIFYSRSLIDTRGRAVGNAPGAEPKVRGPKALKSKKKKGELDAMEEARMYAGLVDQYGAYSEKMIRTSVVEGENPLDINFLIEDQQP